jgi:3D (Asp-Asp-Asp) domain-containing protein
MTLLDRLYCLATGISMCVILIFSSLNYNTIKDVSEKVDNLYIEIPVAGDDTKVTTMRVTAYIPTGRKTALMEDVQVGYTAAVSPECIYLLGSTIYVRGYGIRYINDLTSDRLDKEHDMCTLDLAVPNTHEAKKVGNKTHNVVRIK